MSKGLLKQFLLKLCSVKSGIARIELTFRSPGFDSTRSFKTLIKLLFHLDI